MREGYAMGNNGKELDWILIKLLQERVKSMKYTEYFFFSVKDRNLFYLVNTIGNIFTSIAATRENIPDGVVASEEEKREILWEKEKILVTSIFSFSHNIFYPLKEKLSYFEPP